MIIWINGAFGAGKTQTAYELHRRLPGSFVFDPENAGYYIRRNLPKEGALDNFQDYAMWRSFNYAMLSHIAAVHQGTVIVPMTLVNPQYFDELVGRLREDGVTVRHFALCVSRETLLRRLRGRGEGNRSWAAAQIDRCVAALSDDRFATRLDTDRMPVEQVAETVAELAGIELRPDDKSPFGRKLARLRTQLRHIRLF